MTNGEKWILWLKATLITVIFILLLLEVLIVSNEALKVLDYESIKVSCASGVMKLNYGSKEFRLGSSFSDLQRCASFVAKNPAVLLPPFNLIYLMDKFVKIMV